ncbi:hypothetical protein MNBD_IGNAVI01-2442 [hydrothermal vent metagenome]|uniref:Major facilitator superfamily (MFS) profile domain-containing protein n=1 Tax=hydrothermal vent metagenome TaxID=652676 RepID=A0A3B1C5D6_9ZZZZ
MKQQLGIEVIDHYLSSGIINISDNKKIAFALVTILFLLWGSIVSLNDILIPHFKKLFEMNYTETMLVQFSFFGAYFLVSFPASLIVEKIGYQKGIIVGLLIICIGSLLFIPASWLISYPLFLFGLFAMAAGSVFLQVVATPYISILGPTETASSRLNFAEGLTALGATFVPLIGAFLILSSYNSLQEQAAKVQMPYGVIAVIAFLIAIVFIFVKLPAVEIKKNHDKKNNVLKFRQLRLGVIALMLYVGAEVSVASFIVIFLHEPNIANLSYLTAAQYIPFYWGGLLIGRFIGAAILQKVHAHTVLAWSAIASLILLGITIFTSGYIAMWSMLGVGLFNSIMWPNIFSLAIDGLGEYRIKASGILVMAAVGGAIFPVLQGMLADTRFVGLHLSYILPFSCYIFILYYALNGFKPLMNRSFELKT